MKVIGLDNLNDSQGDFVQLVSNSGGQLDRPVEGRMLAWQPNSIRGVVTDMNI